ncbi:hypothetical protein HCB33_02285 [Listeria sp. FSL L7-0233]|uniref:hypothetical protein n=1 Tax=Listeria cossartiae TaxID=2838249 RepID=UPI001629ED46|nr:hypothetical protein [Listeria cossartiae]MBC1543731.1 hypothetical protein [Listeria cossartiae subsp. cossartiae]MBC1545930.1 hypothetical protein [Listeria cossartiae subsp. cossartiae]MBC1548769.1 hypothetical protein [Listeria cossartiae subsp. cossartiae]MBC1569173.1 hypothetical protein [Listeria cossartiae subsp. cossartiae]MBC1570436.1 hypothetical protein [Listeria cossartiae subsp. cossartiae]
MNKLLLITAAGYIVGARGIENEKRQSIQLRDVYINNPSQRLIDHFESIEIAKEQIIGHKKLSTEDAKNLISRWEASYFTTS